MSTYTKKDLITSLVDKYLITREEDKRKGGFHPSSIYRCARELYYGYLGYLPEKVNGSRALRIFDVGHAVEGCYDKYFSDMDKMEKKNKGIFNGFSVIGMNTSVEDKELNINGEYDKIIEIDGDKYLIDIKTTKDNMWGWEKIPFENHIQQVQIYLFLTGIKNGVLIYINKNTQEQAEFHFEYDKNIFEKVKTKIKYLTNCINKKQVPMREHKKTDKECQWCVYFNTCWEVIENV